jgi:phosphoribosylformylglycinamidine synthase
MPRLQFGRFADSEGLDIGEPWPAEPPRPSVALAQNESARFIDRWCAVEIPADTRCIWTQGLGERSEVGGQKSTTNMLPIAHGEGRFMAESDDVLHRLEEAGQVAVRYAADDNPNGSTGHVAGICDASGLVFGLMPHPERFTTWTHHPAWTRLQDADTRECPLGLAMFRNAVQHVVQNRHALSK